MTENKKNNINVWNDNLNKLIKYIDDNNERPSKYNKNEDIKYIARWCTNQIQYYKKKSKIMNDNVIYLTWKNFISHDNYKKYFLSTKDNWLKTFKKYVLYVENNYKVPKKYKWDNPNSAKQLNVWYDVQSDNYKNKKNIMKDNEIYNMWTKFINDYKQYLLSNKDKWLIIFNKVEKYVNKTKKKLIFTNKNMHEKKFDIWIIKQQYNYKYKYNMMNDEIIYDKWKNFINAPNYVKYLKYYNDNNVNNDNNNDNDDNDNDIIDIDNDMIDNDFDNIFDIDYENNNNDDNISDFDCNNNDINNDDNISDFDCNDNDINNDDIISDDFDIISNFDYDNINNNINFNTIFENSNIIEPTYKRKKIT